MSTPKILAAFYTTGSLRPIERGILAALLAISLVALTGPASGHAQETMNAQALTSEGITLTAAELGPEWSLVAHHTETLQSGTRLSFMEPTPTPTPVPAVPSIAPTASMPDPATTSAVPHCQPGETPRFRLGFATHR